MHLLGPGLRALLVAVFAALILTTAQAPAPAAAATSQAAAVIANARHHIGAPWRYGATGPYAFDCSGLVLHAFKEAGLLGKIGSGTVRSASGLYAYFRNRGLASRTGGKPGDLVIYGGGSHVGIYLGDGRVISTLTSGVRVHGLHAVNASFTAFLHTRLGTTLSSSGILAIRYTTLQFNMRVGPGTSYAIVKSLPIGSGLVIYKSALDRYGKRWFYGRESRGHYGWVPASYTRL